MPRATPRFVFVEVATAFAALLPLPGCYAGISATAGGDTGQQAETGVGDAGSGDSTGGPDDVPPETAPVPVQGLRRLSAAEYDQTVRDLLGLEALPSLALLPGDARTPFDNDYAEQLPSEALVRGVDILAETAATALLADPERRDALVGCIPEAADDEACMRAFVARFGRLALRRPLQHAELDAFVLGTDEAAGALSHAVAEADFYVGVDFVVRALLADAEFLYRVELGTPIDPASGVFRLGPYEVATRLSYLVWGSSPDDELLDRAAAGLLDDADGIADATRAMLEDPRASARIERFHAMWIGYENMTVPGELGVAMRAETAALIDDNVFDQSAAWQDLFRATGTFIDDALAAHYGLEASGQGTGVPRWVDYGESGRRGILSHGSFLSLGSLADDTSPVKRGVIVQERLLCNELPPPPPNVNTDVAPSGNCKLARYAAHRQGACAGCHAFLDPVGFGLENYDATGRYRVHEADDPETDYDESTCTILGDGELSGAGSFNGPGELAAVALASGSLERCFFEQLHRFVVGRGLLDAEDDAVIDLVREQVGKGDFRFDEVLLQIVTDESFVLRRVEPDR